MLFSRNPVRDSRTKGASSDGNYIEDLFSVYAYNGSNTSNQIVNDIDLQNNKGMVWIKDCNNNSLGGDGYHWFYDTVRGNKHITPNSNAIESANTSASRGLTSFNNNGFTVGESDDVDINNSNHSYISYTFRAAPNFFDAVPFTSNSTGGAVVSHSLRTNAGLVLLKYLDIAADMYAFHTSLPATQYLKPGTTSVAQTSGPPVGLGWGDITFSYGLSANQRCMLYIFPFSGTGFGVNKSASVVKSGSFTISGSYSQIDLGFEPQFLLIKSTTSVTTNSWYVIDNIKNDNRRLNSYLPSYGDSVAGINSTGFLPSALNSGTYIYLAIRNGDMRIPTDANTVFAANTYTGTGATSNNIITSNFPPDLIMSFNRDGSIRGSMIDRKRGDYPLYTASYNSETYVPQTDLSNIYESASYSPNKNYLVTGSNLNKSSNNYVSYAFKRAASFFDMVYYRGTGAVQNIKHNLGVSPDLILFKARNQLWTWFAYSPFLFNGTTTVGPSGQSYIQQLTNSQATYGSSYFNNTLATSTQFTLGNAQVINSANYNYLAYLFASCPGVSKVGYYTGNGSTSHVIDCGFPAGARFVLIKCMNLTGNWNLFDTARGMTSGASPSLIPSFTGTNNEVVPEDNKTTSIVQTYAGGFKINSNSLEVNDFNGIYLYFAIA